MRLLLSALIALELLQPFRPAAPYGPGHRGIDLRATGPVMAPISGTVAFAGPVGGVPTMVIERGATRVTLQPVRARRSIGAQVVLGEVVGISVDHPRYHCRGCLHIGVRVNGAYVDPRAQLHLGPVGRSVWVE